MWCCRRPAKIVENTSIKSTIECERIVQTSGKPTGNHTKMDSVIHYITTLPVISNLLCVSHHEYLPNEFVEVQIEPDMYFQLVTLKHSDGQVEFIKFS